MEDNKPSAPDPEAGQPPSKEKETFAAYIQIVGPVFYNREFSDKTKLLYGLLAAMTQAPRYYAFAYNPRKLQRDIHRQQRYLHLHSIFRGMRKENHGVSCISYRR